MEPQAPITSSQTPVQPVKDNHGITIAAMATFILLSLAAVIFLYYQNQKLKTMLASYQATPTPTAKPVYTPIESASPSATIKPKATCKPRPACLDATPRCLIPETPDMCPPASTP